MEPLHESEFPPALSPTSVSRAAHGKTETDDVSLKVELKPGERLIVGGCVITNSDQRTRLTIDGKLPILREKDILKPEDADTPAKLLYLAVQLMYLEGSFQATRTEYFSLVNSLATEMPGCIPIIDEVNNEILTNNLYKALKASKKLIQFEKEHPNAEFSGPGVSAGVAPDGSAT
jgi:flagellar biosynthesis repressor protein FlbT